ncbi:MULTISPECIES: hypothetical protein [Streptomyces]|uniref:Uncharacterized protein n=1 Tax=Streptomyces glycanivorans TaxID=3033808 RepID=A0ABY9JRM5_9ACTN|nr:MULTISPECIES: hypothetical protein [unclassified Streptomyces]WLQ69239.1 hypothetical protein P8A20_37535 [Streptomyces sp. Alt3]WSR53372.1 hypothetical protein OG279_37875 [Streptomyces sp. NBC_01201]
MSVTVRWQTPGNPWAMAQEVEDAAYDLRLNLQDEHGGGITTPEALVAEERADQIYDEFLRIYGTPYNRYLV